MIDFKDIGYLKNGNLRQQNAFDVLSELDIFEKLKEYNPILPGTIPIEIDLPKSDLDIICECKNQMPVINIKTNNKSIFYCKVRRIIRNNSADGIF